MFTSQADLVFAVADGVGGYAGGKEASRMAVDNICKRAHSFDSEGALRSCLFEIDLGIKERARQLHYRGMGTTLAVAKVMPNVKKVLTANVGDSPILLVSGMVTPLYTDDSMRFEDPENMWSIKQYLGCEGIALDVHTRASDYKDGDVLLLCSDGVSDNILGTSNDLFRVRDAVSKAKSAKALVEMAIRRRIKADDMSALLVFL